MVSIALEGPDFAGKSTLSKQIISNWMSRSGSSYELVHTGSPGKKPEGETNASWANKQTSLLVSTIRSNSRSDDFNHLVVYDRLHWGAPIYGPLHREDTNYRDENFGDLGHTGFMYVDSVLATLGGLTVHVGTPLHILLERAGQREDPYLDDNSDGKTREQQLQELWFRYYQFGANVGQYLPSSLEHPIFMGDSDDSLVRKDMKLLSSLNAMSENKDNWVDHNRLEHYLWNNIHNTTAGSMNIYVVADYLINKAIDRQIKTQHNVESKSFLSAGRQNSKSKTKV